MTRRGRWGADGGDDSLLASPSLAKVTAWSRAQLRGKEENKKKKKEKKKRKKRKKMNMENGGSKAQ